MLNKEKTATEIWELKFGGLTSIQLWKTRADKGFRAVTFPQLRSSPEPIQWWGWLPEWGQFLGFLLVEPQTEIWITSMSYSGEAQDNTKDIISKKWFGAVHAIWKTSFGAVHATWKTSSGAVHANWKTSSGAVHANWKTSSGAVHATWKTVLEPFTPFQWRWSRDSETFLLIWRG